MRCGIATWRTQIVFAWLRCERDVAYHACYGIATINTATKLASRHCGLKDANHACLVRICDLTDGTRTCFAASLSEGRKSRMRCVISTFWTQMVFAWLRCDRDVSNHACYMALRPEGRKPRLPRMDLRPDGRKSCLLCGSVVRRTQFEHALWHCDLADANGHCKAALRLRCRKQCLLHGIAA